MRNAFIALILASVATVAAQTSPATITSPQRLFDGRSLDGWYTWTKDHGRALRMSRGLDFGVVWINTHIPFVSEMPHGGFKHSGYGKDLSMYGLEDYTRIKHVMSYIG